MTVLIDNQRFSTTKNNQPESRITNKNKLHFHPRIDSTFCLTVEEYILNKYLLHNRVTESFVITIGCNLHDQRAHRMKDHQRILHNLFASSSFQTLFVSQRDIANLIKNMDYFRPNN